MKQRREPKAVRLKRLGERAMKASIDLAACAELEAELSFARSRAARSLVQLAEELEAEAKG